jgi:hypothetical protein
LSSQARVGGSDHSDICGNARDCYDYVPAASPILTVAAGTLFSSDDEYLLGPYPHSNLTSVPAIPSSCLERASEDLVSHVRHGSDL